MQKTTKRIADLLDNPRWGRNGKIDQAVIVGLAGSIEKIGLQIPIFTYGNVIIEGHCRVRAFRHLGKLEIPTIEFDHEPTPIELLTVPAHLDFHRTNLSPVQRAKVLAELQRETKWTVTELAENLHITQSTASKLLAIDKAPPEVKGLLEAGKLCVERAAMLSQVTDPAMIQQAVALDRDQLRQAIKGKGKGTAGPKLSSARFTMVGGYTVSLSGGQMDLESAVQVLTEAVRLLKKAVAQGLDVSTAMRVFRDTAKAGKPPA